MKNKIKERIGFHYLMAEIQPCTLILLESNIFHKIYKIKSKINPSLTTYLEYNLIILLRVDFTEYKFHIIDNYRLIFVRL